MSQNALLVGGNSGIGHATAKQLLNSGWSLSAAARTAGPLEELGVSTQPFSAAEVPALQIPEVLDALVYFPGTINLKPFHRLTVDDFRDDFEVNCLAAAQVIQQALPALKKSGAASIVLFSTVAVGTGMPFHASIAAAKGAVEGLGRSLAAELAPRIRVNMIAPSLTATPLAESLISNDTKREAAEGRHPLNRLGDPDEVARAVAFLLSADSGFMTGEVLRLDGGMSSVKLFQ